MGISWWFKGDLIGAKLMNIAPITSGFMDVGRYIEVVDGVKLSQQRRSLYRTGSSFSIWVSDVARELVG